VSKRETTIIANEAAGDGTGAEQRGNFQSRLGNKAKNRSLTVAAQ
jgi:hypothetical protein